MVLGSPYLLDRASLHLPRGISYFLLYLALESHNQLAVKKLVEKWPHGDLTLDFLSQSQLCRRHRCSDARCLEPHEYMGVFGSYTRYSNTEMVASLLEGVFYNLYSYHGLVGSQQHVGLRHVDMSAVVINPKQRKFSQSVYVEIVLTASNLIRLYALQYNKSNFNKICTLKAYSIAGVLPPCC